MNRLILFLLLVPLVLAANDPGHDVLYIEEEGDSELNGSINVTDETRVENLLYSSNLHLLGNGTILGAPSQPRMMGGTSQLYIDSTGNLYVNTLGGTSSVIQLGDTATNAITLNVSGLIRQQNVLVCLANGSNCPAGANATGNVTGSGSTNTVAKWVSATELGDSIIVDDGNVSIDSGTLFVDAANNRTGIGTTSPQYDLEVQDTGDFAQIVANRTDGPTTILSATNLAGFVGTLTDDDLRITTNNAVKMIVTSNGSVGIGTTNPGYNVDINSTSIASQLHFSGTGSDDGGYLTATSTGGLLSGQAAYNGTAWIAKDTGAAVIGVADFIEFHTDSGLTAGNSFTPTSRMIINSSGSVGIGTTAPEELLHVNGTIRTNITSCSEALETDGSGNIVCGTDATGGGGAGVWVAGSGTIYNTTASVGIGTANPEEKLSLYENANDNTIVVSRNINSTGASAASAVMTRSNTSQLSIISHGPARTLTRYGIELGNWTEVLAFNLSSIEGLVVGTAESVPLVFGTTSLERMRIDGQGYVGIGTTIPSYELHVNKSVNATVFTTVENANTSSGAAAGFRALGNSSGRFFDIAVTSPNYGAGIADTAVLSVGPSLDKLSFFMGGAGGEVMVIDNSNGNVGIGSFNPENQLTLTAAGDVIIKFNSTENSRDWVLNARNSSGSFLINNQDNAGNEYVFSSTGNLTVLEDVCVSAGNCLSSVTSTGGGWTDGGAEVALTTAGDNVSVGSTPTLFIDNTNNRTGIGTTNPAYKLHFQGSTGANNFFMNGTNSGIILSDYDAAANQRLTQLLQNEGRFRIRGLNDSLDETYAGFTLNLSNGNVGIGTTSPESELHIVSMNTTADLQIEDVDGNSSWRLRANSVTNQFAIIDNNNSVTPFKIERGAPGNTLYLNSSGNVGIGTENPAEELHIEGATNPTVLLNDTTTPSYGILQMQDTNMVVGPQSAGALVLHGAGAEVARVTGTGRFGVSSGSPDSLFTVGGNVAIGGTYADNNAAPANGLLVEGNVGIGTTTPGSQLTVGDGTAATNILINGSATGLIIQADNASTVNNTVQHWISDTTGMYQIRGLTREYVETTTGITLNITSGNVGIGTTSPSVVTGKGVVIEDATTPILQLKDTTTGTTSNDGANIALVDSDFYITNREDGPIHFFANLTERMTILSGGNVGIGTTIPSGKLHVNGSGTVISYITSSDAGAVQLRLHSNSTNNRRIVAGGDDLGTETQIAFDGDSIIFSGTTKGTDDIMKLNSTTGNVGIGTASPSALLHIDEEDAVTALLVQGGNTGNILGRFERDVGATSTIDILDSGGEPQISFDTVESSSPWAIGVDNTDESFNIAQNSVIGTNDYFTILNTGNVGIGTTSPTQELTINKSQNDQTFIRIRNDNASANAQAGIQFGRYDVGSAQSLIYRNNSNNNLYFDARSGSIVFQTWTGNTAMVIDTAQEVGINTSSPGDLFHVAAAGGDFVVESTGNVGIGTTAPQHQLDVVDNGTENVAIQVNHSDGESWKMQSTGSGYSEGAGKFTINEIGSGTRLLIQNNTGYVGIGTNTPSTRLEVNGNVTLTATSNCVILGGGAKFCGNSTCGWIESPDGGTRNMACN